IRRSSSMEMVFGITLTIVESRRAPPTNCVFSMYQGSIENVFYLIKEECLEMESGSMSVGPGAPFLFVFKEVVKSDKKEKIK
ncbi:hypothetical protein HMI54_012077, partial [Coelomomyces lativittatus]